MHRLARAFALATLMLAAVPQLAAAHQGNPNFRSIVHGFSPPVSGLTVQVIGYDAFMQLVNHSRQAGRHLRLRRRAVCAPAPGRNRPNQSALAGPLSQRGPFRAGDRATDCQPKGSARLEDPRQDRPAHLARPSDALDGLHHASPGKGQAPQDEDLRLQDSAAGRWQAGQDRGHLVLGGRGPRLPSRSSHLYPADRAACDRQRDRHPPPARAAARSRST